MAPLWKIMDDRDNIAVVMTSCLSKGSAVAVNGISLTARDDVPFAHKVAIRPIARGERVFKYGEPVGIATADIAPGEHVHVHNVISGRHTVK